MKKIIRTFIIILGCLLFSCNTKPKKQEPKIINTPIQNYKFDDDELISTRSNNEKKLKEDQKKAKQILKTQKSKLE